MEEKQKILITGANGFLGRHLADYFMEKGMDVSGLVRNTERYPFKRKGVLLFKGVLPDQIDPRAFEGVQYVIHCAYTTRLTSPEETDRVNYRGTENILKEARRAGAERFVFISSVGAHPAAESRYGKSKFELEQKMDPERDLIIKPGLIIGKGEDGSFNRMKASLAGLGVIPLFGGGKQILQTVHVDDLCRAVDVALEMKKTGTYVVAEPEGPTMGEFFKMLGEMMGKKCRLIPLPLNLTLVGLKLFEMLRIPFPLSSENLLGLKHMIHMESKEDLARLGIGLRSARESLKDTL